MKKIKLLIGLVIFIFNSSLIYSKAEVLSKSYPNNVIKGVSEYYFKAKNTFEDSKKTNRGIIEQIHLKPNNIFNNNEGNLSINDNQGLIEPILVAELNPKIKSFREISYYYAFAEGDEIILNFITISPFGTNQIAIYESPNNIRYENKKFRVLTNVSIKVVKKSIYRFSISTNYILGRGCFISIKRKPASSHTENFNTKVRMIQRTDTIFKSRNKNVFIRDTVYSELINTTFRVYSKFNLNNPNQTYINLKIPQGTAYWVYWVGIEPESSEAINDLAISLQILKSKVLNPVAAYGLGIINSLPTLKNTVSLHYRFMDLPNLELFLQEQPYNFFTFKEGHAISADYSKINMGSTPNNGDLYMCFWNNSNWVGRDVNLQVGTFSYSDRNETIIIKKPKKILISYFPEFDE